MKIHFCDLCNESVPQTDLDRGVAVLRKGRVVCAACEASMSLAEAGAGPYPGAGPRSSPGGGGTALAAPPAAAPWGQAASPAGSRSAGGSVGSFLAVVFATLALAAAGGMALLLFDRIQRGEQEAQGQRLELSARIASAQRLLEGELAAATEGALRSDEEAASELGALRDRIEQAHDADRRGEAELGKELARLATLLEGLGPVPDQLEGQAAELTELRGRVTEMGGDLRLLAEQMLAIQEAPPPAPVAGVEGPAPPAWSAMLGSLASPNAGDRWSAVQVLGESGDLAVVEHLVPMLKDEDIFVRMATARVLGDLNAVRAIPALIEALDDEEASVREASVVSLRTISGRNFKFDPTAAEGERARRVKAWSEWWKKAADELLGEDADSQSP